MKIKTTAAGQNANQTIDLKLDQKAKTVELKSEFIKTQVAYQISGDVLTFKNVDESVLSNSDISKITKKLLSLKMLNN